MPGEIAGSNAQEVTLETLDKILQHDTKVKVAGVDIDGVLRGKLMSKKKFLGITKDGFGFCSVIFGWDMHDQTYFKELKISNAENGYRDIIAVPDLSSFRRIPWEDNVPFFLVSFMDPDTGGPVSACPRGLLKTAVDKLEKQGMGAMAGGKAFNGFPTAVSYGRLTDLSMEQPSSNSFNFELQPTLMSHRLNAIHPLPHVFYRRIQSMLYLPSLRVCLVTV